MKERAALVISTISLRKLCAAVRRVYTRVSMGIEEPRAAVDAVWVCVLFFGRECRSYVSHGYNGTVFGNGCARVDNIFGFRRSSFFLAEKGIYEFSKVGDGFDERGDLKGRSFRSKFLSCRVFRLANIGDPTIY